MRIVLVCSSTLPPVCPNINYVETGDDLTMIGNGIVERSVTERTRQVEMLCVLFIVLTIITAIQCELGSCPPTLPVDICEATCGPEVSCKNVTQLCCPTACGGSICVDPVTKRHFVTLVKPGKCPEFPRGPWVCTHTCTGDSDCPRSLKCCANRCGALTCLKPDLVEETTVAGPDFSGNNAHMIV